MTDNDSPEQESSGTTRRAFLGAATAAAALPTAAGSAAGDDADDRGAEETTSTDPTIAFANIQYSTPIEQKVSYDVVDYDDPHVGLELGVGGAMITLDMEPDEADRLASELEAAANREADHDE